MAVLLTTYGLDISAYDQLAGERTKPVKAAPGFPVHGACRWRTGLSSGSRPG